MTVAATSPRWRFFRAGGFDQVRLDTGAELLAIGGLDQKLWVALSCPTTGIEFDARTLALIDSDGDGHIRAPELIAAATWAGSRLKSVELLAAGLAGVAPAAIRDDDEEGRLLAAAARLLATELGKSEQDVLSVDEAGAAESRRQTRLDAEWEARRNGALPLGETTEAAYTAVLAVSEKVDDFFARCRLASFDSRAAAVLNADEEAFKLLGTAALKNESAAIAALPLAHIEAGRALPLGGSLNPAWAARIGAVRDLAVEPLLGTRTSLSEADWQLLRDKLAPFAAWQAAKPAPGGELPPEAKAALDLERLARYVRDLLPLANNFVAFRDFYTRQGKATFQVGTLYLDGRSAELVVAVNDAAKHAALAGLSRICLVYCDCVRPGGAKTTIAAAFTAGDSDQLMVGRNGVFYDRKGQDWNATITRIVEHPISLRQAFWSPYKRLARMIGEQLQKLAASKASAVDAQMANTATAVGKKVETLPGKAPPPPTAAQQAFDVGKFAGIFAAIGLAVGALGTALASVVTGMLGLRWWQMPLVFAGLLLAISGPAVALAWFKLRSRNLGPILDANGWAINARARINIPFGTSLTGLAKLPDGAERSMTDPYADKPTPWGTYIVVLLVVAIVIYTLLNRGGA
jgi:hypothetical protein